LLSEQKLIIYRYSSLGRPAAIAKSNR